MSKSIFFDNLSEMFYKELTEKAYPPATSSKVMLEFGGFNIAQSYVTSKVENRYGDIVHINIEGGRHGIELQESLFDIKGKKLTFAYLITEVKDHPTTGRLSTSGSSRHRREDTSKILVRRLPILGIKDWLLIYEDTLFLLAVKDAYDEMEIIATSN